MRRFWVVLLSLGLVMAFSMSAFATSADFVGQYYVRQTYYSNPSLLDQNNGAGRDSWAGTDMRFRIFMRLKVVEGVLMTSSTDIQETVWGRDQALIAPSSSLVSNAASPPNANTMRNYNTPNASFEQLWLTFQTGIGQFQVGNKPSTPYSWGTRFLSSSTGAGSIVWSNTYGPWTYLVDVGKLVKGDFNTSGKPNLAAMDTDRDYYDVAMKYQGQAWEGGLLTTYFRFADQRVAQTTTAPSTTTASGALSTVVVLNPYFKTKVGPLYFEGEGYYMGGKVDYSDSRAITGGPNSDQAIKAKGLYLYGKYNMGPAWVGATFQYTSGADPSASPLNGGDITGGMLKTFSYGGETGGPNWTDRLPVILYGYSSDTIHALTPLVGNAADQGQSYDNLWLYQVFGGYSVTKKLSFDGKLSFAKLDKVAAGYSDSLGTELDLHAGYQLYDCLSYNVGVAYLWTGDYYKGLKTENVAPTYMLSQWINLIF